MHISLLNITIYWSSSTQLFLAGGLICLVDWPQEWTRFLHATVSNCMTLFRMINKPWCWARAVCRTGFLSSLNLQQSERPDTQWPTDLSRSTTQATLSQELCAGNTIISTAYWRFQNEQISLWNVKEISENQNDHCVSESSLVGQIFRFTFHSQSKWRASHCRGSSCARPSTVKDKRGLGSYRSLTSSLSGC